MVAPTFRRRVTSGTSVAVTFLTSRATLAAGARPPPVAADGAGGHRSGSLLVGEDGVDLRGERAQELLEVGVALGEHGRHHLVALGVDGLGLRRLDVVLPVGRGGEVRGEVAPRGCGDAV